MKLIKSNAIKVTIYIMAGDEMICYSEIPDKYITRKFYSIKYNDTHLFNFSIQGNGEIFENYLIENKIKYKKKNTTIIIKYPYIYEVGLGSQNEIYINY